MLQDLELQSNSAMKGFESNHLLQSPAPTARQTKTTRNFGKCLVFCFFRGEPIFTLGPHWYLFLCMFTTFLVSGLMISFLVAKHASETSFYIMMTVTAMQSLMYFMTAIKNPGICSSSQELDEKAAKSGEFCTICKIKLERETYHCQDCDVCCRKFDHHCPWTGKCIGAGNIALFNTFLTTTIIFIITAIFMSVHWV